MNQSREMNKDTNRVKGIAKIENVQEGVERNIPCEITWTSSYTYLSWDYKYES